MVVLRLGETSGNCHRPCRLRPDDDGRAERAALTIAGSRVYGSDDVVACGSCSVFVCTLAIPARAAVCQVDVCNRW